MKKILLLGSPSDDSRVIGQAVASTGRGLCRVNNAPRAFEVLGADLDDLDLIIIDTDRNIHPMAFLEAISGCEKAPPVIVVTELETEYMAEVTRRHGAVACISKPFTARQLASLIKRIVAAQTDESVTCDLWGHPLAKRKGAFHKQCV